MVFSMLFSIWILLSLAALSASFRVLSVRSSRALSASSLNALKRKVAIPKEFEERPAATPGEDLPEEVACLEPIYDMILVERFNQKTQTAGGLFVPQVEGKDLKQLAKVLSVPKEYGLESEQGRIQPLEDYAKVKVGDLVYVREPWGIGPKNIEVGERCFSFHKIANVLAVIPQ
jgi:co-chaperonin GroES (HSP10)